MGVRLMFNSKNQFSSLVIGGSTTHKSTHEGLAFEWSAHGEELAGGVGDLRPQQRNQ